MEALNSLSNNYLIALLPRQVLAVERKHFDRFSTVFFSFYKLYKLFRGVKIFSAPGMGRVKKIAFKQM